MKGLIIQWFYGSKIYLIWGVIISIGLSVAVPLFYNYLLSLGDGDPEAVFVAASIPMLAVIFSGIMPLESVISNFAHMTVCKFQGFAITTMKPTKFILSQFAIHGVTLVISAVLTAIPIISMSIFIDGYTHTMLTDNVKLAAFYLAFATGGDYISHALILKTKNRDKAALILMGVMLTVVLIIIAVVNLLNIEIDTMQLITAITDGWHYAVIGMAVLFSIGSAVMLKLIRKGETI